MKNVFFLFAALTLTANVAHAVPLKWHPVTTQDESRPEQPHLAKQVRELVKHVIKTGKPVKPNRLLRTKRHSKVQVATTEVTIGAMSYQVRASTSYAGNDMLIFTVRPKGRFYGVQTVLRDDGLDANVNLCTFVPSSSWVISFTGHEKAIPRADWEACQTEYIKHMTRLNAHFSNFSR